jgi:TetR/AcrR family transcriptional regulator
MTDTQNTHTVVGPARDMRRLILEEATRMFAARGYDGVSLQDLADAVGIRKPSLLYHYPSKDHLRRAVLDSVMAHWNEAVPRLLRAFHSVDGRVLAIVTEVEAFFGADPLRARLLLREALDRPEELREMMLGYVIPWMRVMTQFIERGKDMGVVRRDVDPQAFVAHCMVLMISVSGLRQVVGSLMPGEEPPRERLRDEMLRMIQVSLTTGLSAQGAPEA